MISDKRVYSYSEAIKRLHFGEYVRSTEWSPECYIYQDDNGFYRDENNELFDFNSEWDEDEFVIWEEKEGQEQNQTACGIVEHGDHQRESSEKNNKRGSADKQTNTKKKETLKTESDTPKIKMDTEIKQQSAISDTTKSTKSESIKKELNEQGKTESEKMKNSENITLKTEMTNLQKSTPIERGGIQPLACTQLSEHLKTENSNSIDLLDNSAKHLIDLGKSLGRGKTDYDGQEIQRAAIVNIDTAVQCFMSANQLMKTKLEYLKFGKELINK